MLEAVQPEGATKMTTTIHNSIEIEASPQQVWDVLTDLDGLAAYDPIVKTSTVIGDERQGIGAMRKCTVNPRNWYKEKITLWEPHQRLEFSIVECNLPMHSLTHTYTIDTTPTGTRVAQVMNYEMKFGFLGRALDRIIVR